MKYKLINTIVVAILLAICFGATVHAAAQPERSLGISPLRSELTISPGTSFDGKITLTNSGNTTLTATMNAEVFSVINQAYDYSFDPTGKGADWVTFTAGSLIIKAGKSASVSYKVAVPIDAEPGGRYLSLFASTSPSTSIVGVTSVNRVASLLYVTVAGDVTRTGKVLTFSSPSLTFHDPAWSVTIQNSGTAHFHSLYNVQLKYLFGGSTISSTGGDSIILPSSVRLLSQPIPHPDWLGIYRLDYTIGLGDVPALKETHYILYLPPLQSLLLIGIIVGLLHLKSGKKLPRHFKD